MAAPEVADILGSRISVLDLEGTVARIASLAASGARHYVCVSNVHTVVSGSRDPVLRQITNAAALATADGLPLVWASRLLGGPAIRGRAAGPDILNRFLLDPHLAALRHYFYGSTLPVLDAIHSKLAANHPQVKVVGTCSPPLRPARPPSAPLDADELQEIRAIDAARPDIVWVGLGAPKQELWMARARPHLGAPVMVGVGAAFDFISERLPRAPLWMQRAGLEWAFRLLQDPGRLAGRYLTTNPLFLKAVFKQALSQRLRGS